MDPVSPVPAGVTTARPDPGRPQGVTPDQERVAREFEAVFLSTVIEEMLKTGQPQTFGGGHAEEMWRSVMARAYADQVAASGGVGLAEAVGESIRAAETAYRSR